MDAGEWIAAFAEQLGVPAPSPAEFETILAFAAEAAHSSERIAAPVACWLGATAGRTPNESLEIARTIGERDSDAPSGAEASERGAGDGPDAASNVE